MKENIIKKKFERINKDVIAIIKMLIHIMKTSKSH